MNEQNESGIETTEPIDGVMTPDEIETLKADLDKARRELKAKDRMLKRVARAEQAVEDAQSYMEGLRADLADAQKAWKDKVKVLQNAVKDASKGQPTLPGTDEDDEPQSPSGTAPVTAAPPGHDDAVDWAVNVLEKSQLREKLNADHPGISQTVVDKLVDYSVGTIGLLESRMQANPEWWWKDIKGLGKGGKDKVIDALQALRKKFPKPQQLDELIPDLAAESAGRDAQAAGVARGACPYPTDGMQGRSWLIGWDGAATGEPTLAEQAQERAINEGREACRNGIPVLNCPHQEGSLLANHWLSGWQAAADETAKTVADAEPAAGTAPAAQTNEQAA